MTFNDDHRMQPDNLGEMNLIGKGDRRGADLSINCKKCGNYLTTIKLNPYCTIDIRIECKNCGMQAEGHNMWANIEGKE